MNEKSQNTPNLCSVKEECDNQETEALTSETSQDQKLTFCPSKTSPIQLFFVILIAMSQPLIHNELGRYVQNCRVDCYVGANYHQFKFILNNVNERQYGPRW